MNTLTNFTAALIRASTLAYARKWNFLGAFLLIFFGNVFVLGQIDLLPDIPPTSVAPAAVLVADSHLATTIDTSAAVVPSEFPEKIDIPAINLAATVANPATTSISVLDHYLLSGAVRYPTSAMLNTTGNVVLFGHSSYLPIVGNQAYKTFDGIQKLVVGDTIKVYSADAVYAYRVRSVMKESATDASIVLAVPGRVLTLATCDSFGATTDRFVVTADFVGSQAISA